MPLTKEQFSALRQKGLSMDQIVKFEGGQKPSKTPQEEQAPVKPSSPMDVAKNVGSNVLGGANVAINTAGLGLPGMITDLIGGKGAYEKQFIGENTGDIARGAGMGVGMVTDPMAGVTKAGTQMLETAGMKAIDPIKGIIKYSKPEARVGLAEKVRDSMANVKRNLVDSYGKEYEDIVGKSDKKVNLGKVMMDFLDNDKSAYELMKHNEQFGSALMKKDPNATRLDKFVESLTSKEGNLPEELDVKDADALQKWIKNLPGIRQKLSQSNKKGYGQVDFTNSERLMLQLADDIKGEVIGIHPELSSLNKNYGQTMNDLKFIRGKFQKGNTIANLQKFSEQDPEFLMAAGRRLPKNILSDIQSFESSTKLASALKKFGVGAATAAGLGGAGAMGVKAAQGIMQ